MAASAQRVVAELRDAAGTLEPIQVGQLEGKSLQALLDNNVSREIIRNIPIDLFIWYRFHGGWSAELTSRVGEACAAAWGDNASISDILRAASGDASERNPPHAVAFAAALASPPDLAGNPRARLERDLLLIYHVAHSLARRVLEPLVVPYLVEGWTAVVKHESFALRAPFQHVPAVEAAIAETEHAGLKGGCENNARRSAGGQNFADRGLDRVPSAN